MKATLLATLLLSVSVGYSAPRQAPASERVSDDVMLSAIAEVETGNNPLRQGRYGERTQLQILPQTWREYSRLPHSHSAHNYAETERVARAYLNRIRARLRARGLPETPYYIAAGWNAGPNWRELRPGTIAYARRVANLVQTTPVARPEPVAAPVAPVPPPDLSLATVPPPLFTGIDDEARIDLPLVGLKLGAPKAVPVILVADAH